jgi:hypothetical protein
MLNIFTFVTNKPDFIELQLKSFQKHLKEEFTFTVFNNAGMGNPEFFSLITEECTRLGIRSINIQYDQDLVNRCEAGGSWPIFRANRRYKDTGAACGYSVCWAWENIISKHQGHILLMHHDMFLIKDVVLTDYLQTNELVFVPQCRPEVDMYMWEGFVLADMDILPEPRSVNWWCGRVNGTKVDVGGQTWHYLKAHPGVRVMCLAPDHTEDDPNVDFHPSRYEFITFNQERIVLHYRAASDWMQLGPEYHAKKKLWLLRQLS